MAAQLAVGLNAQFVWRVSPKGSDAELAFFLPLLQTQGTGIGKTSMLYGVKQMA
jgi:hypothetical protein